MTIFKWVSQTVKGQKVDWKNMVICLVSYFLSRVMVLKLPKIVHFLQLYGDLSKKSESIKVIYLYASADLKDLIKLFQKIICLKGGSEQQFTRYWGKQSQKGSDPAVI